MQKDMDKLAKGFECRADPVFEYDTPSATIRSRTTITSNLMSLRNKNGTKIIYRTDG